MEELVWVVGGVAGILLLNRFIVRWLIGRALKRDYEETTRRVLFGKEHQVKGRFE